MSNAELVKRLEDVLETWGVNLAPSAKRALTEAIAALSAQDDVRDRVLEEAATWHDEVAVGLGRAMLRAVEAIQIQSAYITSHQQSAAYFRALKSKPAALAWTRKDGSTTPCTGPEDRRKSANGGYNASGIGGLWRRCDQATQYGRRSGDRARWTAAPVVECEHDMQAHLHDLTFCKKCRNIFNADGTPTPPAQEAPQSLDGHKPLYEAMALVADEIVALLDRRMEGK